VRTQPDIARLTVERAEIDLSSLFPSAKRSATSPSRAPPDAVDRHVNLSSLAADLACSFQPLAFVAKTGESGRSSDSFFSAPDSLRTSRMTFHASVGKQLTYKSPDSRYPAAVKSTTNARARRYGHGFMRGSDHGERCGSVDEQLGTNFWYGDRIGQRRHRSGRNNDFVTPRARQALERTRP